MDNLNTWERLYFDLRTRILSQAEMDEVMKIGPAITFRKDESSTQHDRHLEFNDALRIQGLLRIAYLRPRG